MPHDPTRLPYGLSFVKPGVASDVYTFTRGDQTPDVSYGTFFTVAASAITLTNFDGGERGKIIYIHCNTGGAITLQNSAGGLNVQGIVIADSGAVHTMTLSTTSNYIMKNGEVVEFVHNGTDWSQVGASIRYTTQI